MTSRFFRYFTSTLTVLFLATSSVCAQVPNPSLVMTTFVWPSLYRLDVVAGKGASLDNDYLKIACVSGCNSKADYVEHLQGGMILGAYPITDGIVTLWAIGDGGLVRVYHIGSQGITKVLETPTRSQYPIPTTTSDGQPAFIIQGKTAGDLIRDQQAGVAEPTHAVEGDLWIWNGQEYVISGK